MNIKRFTNFTITLEPKIGLSKKGQGVEWGEAVTVACSLGNGGVYSKDQNGYDLRSDLAVNIDYNDLNGFIPQEGDKLTYNSSEYLVMQSRPIRDQLKGRISHYNLQVSKIGNVL